MGLPQYIREKRELLGFKLLVSHLSIAMAGAVFLALSLLFYESLASNVFHLVLESSPRVGLLNTIGTPLQRSQAVLQERVLFGSGSPEDRQRIWKEKIWPTVYSLEAQSKQQWKIQGKAKKLADIKRLLGEIYVQQWKIEDTANTQGDSPARNIFQSQALPQAVSMRKMIESMIFLEERADHKRSSNTILLLSRLRIALDSSLSALERLGYLYDDVTLSQYDNSMADFNADMALLQAHEHGFSAEMADVFSWLGSEQAAYAALGIKEKNASISVTQQIFSTRLRPLTSEVFALLKGISADLKRQLDQDTALAVSQSSQVVWGSRILVILMMILAIWLARRGSLAIITPLASLDRAALEYAAGNLSSDIPEEGSLELRTLSRTFNAMRRSLQESVGLMHSVLETAADAIIMIDGRGIIESFNYSAEQMFGWSVSEAVGRNVSIIMPPQFQDQHDSYIRRYLDSRQSKIIGTGREVMGLRKDGELFPIHLSVSHVEVNDRNIFTGIITDISEQKRIQADLSIARDKAEAASQAKAAFTANMSHEIRTPMNAIIGFAEVVLQNRDLSSVTTKHVATILSSARALLGIINDILDISKLESGKFTLEMVCFHLPNALADALRVVEHQAEVKNLTLEFKYDATLPVRVMGDPMRLRQVILNLVGNSIKFTEQGGIVISVLPGEPLEMIAFAIADTGIGMTDEQVAKVFESFTQADGATTRRFGGTGLGTTISKQIIESMGGEIWAESEPGQGSTFHFIIRMAEAEKTDSCLFEQDGAVADEYFSPRLFRVLLAEDIEANATLATLRLEQQGHKVCWVKNGREAVEESQAGDYDLILMDVQMPELDGLGATREIRKIEQQVGGHLSILALTASVMREDHDKCLVAGMDGVAVKPVDFNELFVVMETVVPTGVGENNSLRDIGVLPQNELDFSSLVGVVDHEKALRTWHNPNVYTKALAAFVAERANDALEVERLLVEHPDNTEPACRVLHALTGVAGNLAIERVARLAAAIGVDLKKNHIEAAKAGVGELTQALDETVIAIGKLRVPVNGSAALAKAFDVKEVQPLVVELSIALDKLDPDVIEPVLDKLAEYITETDLASIQRGVDAFDFDEAQTCLKVLVDKLGLQIDG